MVTPLRLERTAPRSRVKHSSTEPLPSHSMEAKSQQNFYNKAAIVVISSKLSLLSIHFQNLVPKVTKRHPIIHYFRFMLCIAFTLLNNNLAHFSSLNSLGTCVEDMKSCPTSAVESSKIHNGFDTAISRF